jgi:hypothetical protein
VSGRRGDNVHTEIVLINLKDGALSKSFYPYADSSVCEVSLVWLAPQPNATGRIDPTHKPRGYILTAHYNGAAVMSDLNGASEVVFDESHARAYRTPTVSSRGVTTNASSAFRSGGRISSHVDTHTAIWTVRSSAFGAQFINLHRAALVHSWWNPPGPPTPLAGHFSTHLTNSHFFALCNGVLSGYSWATPNASTPLFTYGVAGADQATLWHAPPTLTEKKIPTPLTGTPSNGHPIATCAMAAGLSRFVAVSYVTGSVELIDLYALRVDGARQHEIDHSMKIARAVDVNGYRRGDLVTLLAPPPVGAEAADDDEEEVNFVGTVVSMRHGSLCVQGFPIYSK